MNKLTFEKKQEEVGAGKNNGEYLQRSYRTSSISKIHTDRSTCDKEYDKLSISDEAYPLPASLSTVRHEHQNSRIPRPPPPRRAVLPEDAKKKELFPPIPERVLPLTRATSKSKEVVQDDEPQYGNNGSSGYGKNTKRTASSYVQKSQIDEGSITESYERQQFKNVPLIAQKQSVIFPQSQNKQHYLSKNATSSSSSLQQLDSQHQENYTYFATPPSYVGKTQVVLPPPQQNTRYRSQQSSLDEVSHQDFMQNDESLAIAGHNLIRKDSTVGLRVSKKTTVTTQEVSVRGSIRQQQQLALPMIPQPPKRAKTNNVSRILRLTTTQQKEGLSGLSEPCPSLPQPPTVSRLRAGASHRRYVVREEQRQ